ncbi:acyltransferase [Clostridium sp. LBM24168]
MECKDNRIKEIDIIRGFAFMSVVAQHTIGGFSNEPGIGFFDYAILKFLYTIAKTAVPLFLFISAVLLFYKKSDKIKVKQFYIKKFKYIFIPYAFWSALNMYFLNNRQRLNDFFMEIIAGNGGYHLWYMGMILRLYIVFPLIFLAAKKIHGTNLMSRIFIFIISIIVYYDVNKYNNIISEFIIQLIFGNASILQRRIVNVSIIFWYLYFVIGIYVGLNYKYIKEKLLKYKIAVFLIYICMFVYEYMNEIYPEKFHFVRGISIAYYVSSILVFYIVSILLSNKLKFYKFMNFFGRYSFCAYMIHVILIGNVVQYIRIYFNIKDYLLLGISTWIIVCVISVLFVKIINYIPYSCYITGIKISGFKILNYKFPMTVWQKMRVKSIGK